METCYSDYDHNYIGLLEDAQYFCYKRDLRKLQSVGNSNVCSIGFSEAEQKWYGWSHRAMCGFGVGSVVKRGDCAYLPKTKEELVEDLIEFFELDWTFRACETPDIQVIGFPQHIIFGVPTDEGTGVFIDGAHRFIGDPKRNYNSSYIYPYMNGKGEWAAKTMDEAKEMAIDFAMSVS